MSWDEALINVVGKAVPEDSLELRNSYIEGVMGDIDGIKVVQHQLHQEIQGAIFSWQQAGINDGIVSAPYGGGKSQQVPIGLASYLATRNPNKPHIIISADPDLAKNRIASLRNIFESNDYKYWCKAHNFKPVEYAPRDTDSSEKILLKSKNMTGPPTFFAAGIETKGTGWRCYYLWGDDICNNEDFKSPAKRESRHKAWTNTWTKRSLDKGYEYLIRTPYHPSDANERLLKTNIYAHLEIAVREDKTGYDVKEWIPGKGLIREETIPLWEMNHSKEKLEKEEAKDYAAYQLGFRMLKEVQDPKKSAYKHFSDELYPLGNVYPVEYDWSNKRPLVLTCDFNRSPHCWSLGQRQKLFGREVYCFLEEIVSEDALTEEQAIKAAKLILELGHHHVELRGDGTGNQGGSRYGRSSGENDWKTVTRVLKDYGISFTKLVKKSNPLRTERVKVVNNVIFSMMKGEQVRRMVVNPKCTTIIDDYKFSSTDDHGEKKRDGDRGHISDAGDYWIYGEEKSGNFAFLIK